MSKIDATQGIEPVRYGPPPPYPANIAPFSETNTKPTAAYVSLVAQARRNHDRMLAMREWRLENPDATSRELDAAVAEWEARNG